MSTGRKELNKVTYPLFISGAYYETNKFGAAKVVGGGRGEVTHILGLTAGWPPGGEIGSTRFSQPPSKVHPESQGAPVEKVVRFGTW